MKSLVPFFSGLFVTGSLLHAAEPRRIDDGFLAALRSEAVRNHPANASAERRSAAATREVSALRLWDDPTVGLAVMVAHADMRRDDGDLRISFEQPLPKPGLYAAQRAKAEADGRAQRENSRLTTLETGAAAAKDAIELALADESISLQTARIGWLGSMVENARELAVNPDATSADALRLESELARETEVLASARRSRESLGRQLNLRLGRTLEAPWPDLRLGAKPAAVPLANAEIARIPRVNPKVRSMMEAAAAAAAGVRVADRERQPQFAVGVESSLYTGGAVRSVDVGLKMSLPYFNRRADDAGVQASQLREQAAAGDVEAARLEVAGAVLGIVTDATNAAAQARAYAGEVLERADAATRAVEAAWISSKSPLAELLDSNRQLFAIRLEQRRLIALQLAALEELRTLVPEIHSQP